MKKVRCSHVRENRREGRGGRKRSRSRRRRRRRRRGEEEGEGEEGRKERGCVVLQIA